MRDTPLNRFVEDIMHIDAGYAGMGGASSAIIGAEGTNDQITHSLRRNAIAFATERSKPQPDKKTLAELSRSVEGSLLAIRLFHGISDARLDSLLGELHRLGASHRR